MGLLIVAAIGIAVTGYYILNANGPGVASMKASASNLLAQDRTGTLAPGTTPPAGVAQPGRDAPSTALTSTLVSTGAATGLGFAAMAAAPAGITALGAATLGIGAIVGIGLVLWTQHVMRAKNARDENAAVNILGPGFTEAFQKEFMVLNAGQISPTTALSDLEQIRQTYWAAIAPYQTKTGQHTHPCTTLPSACDNGLNSAGQVIQITKCDKSCTVGCCIGCNVIEVAVCKGKQAIMAGGGTFTVGAAAGSKYGYVGSPKYTITYRAVR